MTSIFYIKQLRNMYKIGCEWAKIDTITVWTSNWKYHEKSLEIVDMHDSIRKKHAAQSWNVQNLPFL